MKQLGLRRSALLAIIGVSIILVMAARTSLAQVGSGGFPRQAGSWVFRP